MRRTSRVAVRDENMKINEGKDIFSFKTELCMTSEQLQELYLTVEGITTIRHSKARKDYFHRLRVTCGKSYSCKSGFRENRFVR